MIVDSSCLLAIVQDEAEGSSFAERILREDTRMSTATWLETCIVVDSRGPASARRLDRLLEDLGVQLVPFDHGQASLARQAFRLYGEGSGSPARLNFGDCFAYALAVTRGEPLLFKGEDFSHTDVRPAG